MCGDCQLHVPTLSREWTPNSSEQDDVKNPNITADDRDRYFIDRAVKVREFRCMPQF